MNTVQWDILLYTWAILIGVKEEGKVSNVYRRRDEYRKYIKVKQQAMCTGSQECVCGSGRCAMTGKRKQPGTEFSQERLQGRAVPKPAGPGPMAPVRPLGGKEQEQRVERVKGRG